jgi:hypothetical protein
MDQASAATGFHPTQNRLADSSQEIPGLFYSGTLSQVEQNPVPLITQVIQRNEVIIESQASPTPSLGLKRLTLPGMFCLLGLILLGTGHYMRITPPPTNQSITAVLNIADLRPELGLVELKGVITQVPRPLDNNLDQPLAVLRLVIESNEAQAGWRVVLDRVLATEFSLEDGTGIVWVSPDQLDLNLLGEGSFASIKQAEEALKTLGLQASSAWGRGLRYHIWELRKGQPLIALGNVEQHFKFIGSPGHPVALSHAPASVQSSASRAPGARNMNALLVLVIAVGGAAFLGGLAWLLWALAQ